MVKINIKNNNSGFVILYAVMLSSILLAIAIGVADISLKEIKFGTSAKETNEAFFAADTAAECALYYDRSAPENNAFTGTAAATMTCAGDTPTITPSGTPPNYWSFSLIGLGESGQGCAKVTVDKSALPKTKIISKGYNNGVGSNCTPGSNTVERELELTY